MHIVSCDPNGRAKTIQSLRERLVSAEEDLECSQVRLNAAAEEVSKALDGFKVDLRSVLELREMLKREERV